MKKKEITIHEKFAKQISEAKENFLTDISYPDAVEILRYIENKRGITLGLNMSCGQCLIDLLKMLDNTK